MAGEDGFEPSNGGFKGRCLTTWRLPNTQQWYQKEDVKCKALLEEKKNIYTSLIASFIG